MTGKLERQQRADLIRAVHESAQGRRAVRRGALVELRCSAREGCLLLRAWAWHSPHGIAYYRPPYKLSPARNAATSSPEGRLKNTRDGDRRWQSRAGMLEDFAAWPDARMPIQCDHVDSTVEVRDLLRWASDATPGKPTRRTSSS